MTREYREYAKSRIEYLLKICRLDERDKEALEAAIEALSQEPCDKCKYFDGNSCQHYDYKVGYTQGYEDASKRFRQEPCDEKRDCSTCKYEEYSSNYQPCRDCGTLLESYTNWEQKERELPCIYDLKNRYCPRLNEHGMLKCPLYCPNCGARMESEERE